MCNAFDIIKNKCQNTGKKKLAQARTIEEQNAVQPGVEAEIPPAPLPRAEAAENFGARGNVRRQLFQKQLLA